VIFNLAQKNSDDEGKADKFLEGVKANSAKAKEHGRAEAIKHYIAMTGADEEEAKAFYEGLRVVCGEAKVILNISQDGLETFFSTKEYDPARESPEMLDKFNAYARKRRQAEQAMGCSGLDFVYASVMLRPEGDHFYGKCAMELRNVGDQAVLLCGDSFRLRNPSRNDYAADPEKVLYAFSDLPDCKASSVILSMQKSDLAGGPAASLARIMDGDDEFGRCEALIFKKVKLANVRKIIVPAGDAASIRQSAIRMGTMLPIVSSENSPQIRSSDASSEPEDIHVKPSAKQRHFSEGDRVMLKPMASHPKALGVIIDTGNGQVTVQWENNFRTVYDWAEALMRLMDAPSESKHDGGMIVYSLPGMDDEAVMALSAVGIDPVTLYSAISCHKPSSKDARGWMDNLIGSMSRLGLEGRMVKGYVPTKDGETAFEPSEWVESRLATGARLIIDCNDGIKVLAGDVDDYVLPDPQPVIEIE
jgi:hypothetical protein